MAQNRKGTEPFQTVLDTLKSLYQTKLLPLEKAYRFHDFHSPALGDAEFDNKPMVLVIGQHSTGKTTFIRHLLQQDYPGMRIGIEPTTDCFVAVMHGGQEEITPGNAVVIDPKKPFSALNTFSDRFLKGFKCSQMPSPVLESISFIDTPGILSRKQQTNSRDSDLAMLELLAERVDRIILLFDIYNVDISDEFAEIICALDKHEHKMRVVLNKADQISNQELIKVHGALQWSLSRILKTPIISRIYIGSFWDRPLRVPDNRKLFEAEEQELLRDIQELPRNASKRKITDLIKRARLARVHAYIISTLKKKIPNVFGKENKKKKLIANLEDIYKEIQREHQISPQDFPDLKKMQVLLADQDFNKFKSMKSKLMKSVDSLLTNDIYTLMTMVHQEEATKSSQVVMGGVFDATMNGPFFRMYEEGISMGIDEFEWVVARDKPAYDKIFSTLSPVKGKVSGSKAKKEMLKSKLPNTVLGKIWELADVDKDGFLDDEEFALAYHLMKVKLEGHELPGELPDHLVPPSKWGRKRTNPFQQP